MPYFLNNADDQRAMLKAIGVESIDDLFAMLPRELRLDRPLDVPPALGELELTSHMSELAAKNDPAGSGICFLGGGSYDHFIPAVVDYIASRSEFVTSYTPYQPEVSQGNLQVLFEYQTLIAQLTGMDYANSSLYDGGSAATEAVLMAMSVTRRPGRVLVAGSVHPDYRQILATYLTNLDVELVTLETPGGTLDAETLRWPPTTRRPACCCNSPIFSAAWKRWKRWPRSFTQRARRWLRLSIQSVWACSSGRAMRGPISWSLKASRWARRCNSAGRTWVSSLAASSSSAVCPAASWGKPSIATAGGAGC